MSSVGRNLNIVLLGKTGNGKSATGNTIAGMNKFEEIDSFQSMTKLITKHISKKNGLIYTIYDTKGLFDADIEEQKDILITIKHMTTLMKECHNVDVFLLVLRFSILSAEDYTTIERLKIIFGPNFIKNHCYIIMTYGDNYNKGIPFENFCEMATGKFRDFYNECGKRMFLIINKGGYEQNSKRTMQGENLRANLQTWLANKSPYSADTDFKAAAPDRNLLAFKSDEDNIRRIFEKQIDDLKAKITKVSSKNKDAFTDLKQELYVLRNLIIQTDPNANTKNLKDLLDQVTQMIKKLEARCTIL